MRPFDAVEERVLRYLEDRYTKGRVAIQYHELKTDLALSDQECGRMFALFTDLRAITLSPTGGTFHVIEPIVCILVREMDAPTPRRIGFPTP